MKKSITAIFLAAMLLFTVSLPAFAASKGDVDGIIGISAADARMILRASVGLEKLSAEQTSAADVDGIAGITAADARLVLRASVGLENLGQEEEKEEVHTHIYDIIISVDREPTCTGNGKQRVACACGREKTEYIDSLGHDYKLSKEEAPTCKKQGKNIYTCTRCSYSRTEYIDRIDHDYQITEEKPAGCTTKGHIRYQCTMCASVKADQFPATGHDYDPATGLCKNCGNSDSSHYDKIDFGEKWIIDGNWEMSIVSVTNHPLDSASINSSHGYTNEQCVLITMKVKNIGYTPHLENATGLIVTPLDFEVYDAEGEQADNYVCSHHTRYIKVPIEGTSGTGNIPFVLKNDSNEITLVIDQTDSDGVIRRAIFTAPVTD